MKKKWCVLPIIINHFSVSTLRCMEYQRNETNGSAHKNEEKEKRINKNPYIYVHKGGGGGGGNLLTKRNSIFWPNQITWHGGSTSFCEIYFAVSLTYMGQCLHNNLLMLSRRSYTRYRERRHKWKALFSTPGVLGDAYRNKILKFLFLELL